MRFFALFIFCWFFTFSSSQDRMTEVLDFQSTLNKKYKSKKTSPLEPGDRRKFKGFKFFPFNEKYVVQASFTPADSLILFEMPTSTTRKPLYRIYGIAEFVLDQKTCQLELYQHYDPDQDVYDDELFLAFRDQTSGNQSYGGGRYIDLAIPHGNIIEIDFHQSYNPYCAYNKRYSCPIPPDNNTLVVPILAGIKYNKK